MEEQKRKNKEQLRINMEKIFIKCEKYISSLQDEQRNLYQRKKELSEFRNFVDHYINPKYKDRFSLFIDRIAEQIAMQEKEEYDTERTVDEEKQLDNVGWQANCMHIGLAFGVWRKSNKTMQQLIDMRKKLTDYFNKHSVNSMNKLRPEQDKLTGWKKVNNPSIADLGVMKNATENKSPFSYSMDSGKKRMEERTGKDLEKC